MAGNKPKYKEKIAYLLICAAVISLVIFLNRLSLFDTPEHSAQDFRFRFRGVEKAPADIVIVAVDAQTLDMMNLTAMPPRSEHVKLIENLYRAGAKAVLFDVLFFGYTGVPVPGSIEPSPSHNDSSLAEALFMNTNTEIARKLRKTLEEANVQTAGESPLPPSMLQFDRQLTFVDMIHDSDSFVRRAWLINDDMGLDRGWQYSLGMRAAMFAIGADTAWVDNRKNEIHVGDRVVPLDNSTNPPSMFINFSTDEKTFASNNNYISYEQVTDPGEAGIELLIKTNRFKDKVVLVGATYPDSKDYESTPFYLGNKILSMSEYPMFGVHIHKNIADTIISGKFIFPVKDWQLWFLIIIMAIIATAVNYKFRGLYGLFFSAILVIVYIIIATYLFISNRIMMPVIAPAFAVVSLNYISVVTYNYLTERKQKSMIRGIFSRYVPGSVVNELLKNPDQIKLGGEERIMTVIFSDVAGFTTISEKLTPTQLVELLNEYLTAMTDIVLRYNGIIDKYEGDAIMAEFGAPLQDDNHALNACYAAIDMQKTLSVLRDKLLAEGRPEIRARVGINSGQMVIGNMGSSTIFDYTVMGDNVNLSSRLEGANKEYGTYIMCSEATKNMVDHEVITRELDILRVKGKTEGVKVFEILARKSDGIGETKQKVINIYLEGLKAYKEKRWEDGIRLFGEAIELDSEESPSKIYLERCRQFKENPPPDDWDGIFTMRTK